MQNYKDLIVWQKAHKMVLGVYQLSKKMPKEETYGLISQLRRCAVSVPANLAEGSGKNTSKDTEIGRAHV